MLIKQLSTKSGFSIDTIRFYEKIGLIDKSRIPRQSNTYKNYSESILIRLLAIRDLKDFGFTLKEIHETILLYVKDPENCLKNVPRLEQKRRLIDDKIAQLTALQKKIIKLEGDCKKDCKNCCGLNKTLQSFKRF